MASRTLPSVLGTVLALIIAIVACWCYMSTHKNWLIGIALICLIAAVTLFIRYRRLSRLTSLD